MRCLVCGRSGANYRGLCKNHNQIYTDGTRCGEAERHRKVAKIAALKEARKTMTDGQLADEIIERWRRS